MARRIVLFSVLVCFGTGLVLLGCGNGDKKVALDDFATESAAAYCGWLFRCCTDQDIQELDDQMEGSLEDESACTTTFAGLVTPWFSTPAQVAIDAGRGSYDEAKAAACLEEVDAQTCVGGGNDLTQLFEICSDAYQGLQGVDAECASQIECQTGTQCFEDTCQNLLAENDACDTATGAHLCADELYCDGATCQQRKGAGETCTGANALECERGYECDDTDLLCTEIVPDTCTGR